MRNVNKWFGTCFRKVRELLGLTQSNVLHYLPVYDGEAYEGNFISRIERGEVKKLDRQLVEELVQALADAYKAKVQRPDGFGPIRQKALVAAAGYNPLPVETLPVTGREAWEQAWEQALVAGFIAVLLEPILPQLIGLARSAANTEAKGLDWSNDGAKARALIADRE